VRGAAKSATVVARLDRATQYSEARVFESRGGGVLDRPLKAGDDDKLCGWRFGHYMTFNCIRIPTCPA